MRPYTDIEQSRLGTMTQAEKAKRFDEALKLAKEQHQYPWVRSSKDVLEEIFPELRESDDEKIRKWLIGTIKQIPDDSIEWETICKSDVLAWLDRPSEEKPDDKFEPKFKDGDVLYDGRNACIFRKKMEDDDAIWVDTYCGINSDGMFNVNDEDECWCLACDCVPATKEQRDLLFQKMKEAGYEWDADKKELEKIEDEEYDGEDYGIDGLWHAKNILEKTLGKVSGYQTDDGILDHKCAIAAVKKLYKQESA